MAYARPIRDIACGTIWIDRRDDSRVIIVAAGERYVEFMREGTYGKVEPAMYERHFRERFEPLFNRVELRSWFTMSLANLANFHAFWSPSLRKPLARSATVAPEEARGAARGRPALPTDAVFVNTYAAPVSAETFFADLTDVIANRAGGDSAAA